MTSSFLAQIEESNSVQAVSSVSEKKSESPSDFSAQIIPPKENEKDVLGDLFSEEASKKDIPIVAILDSGIDLSHTDLSSFLWENSAEKTGIAGKDDDGNGFVDDVYGWNFIDDNADISDDQWHGTHLAGIISEQPSGEDSAPPVQIMVLKISGDSKKVRLSNVLSALLYAREKNADIINMSFGFQDSSDDLHDIIREMHDKGVFLISAAGNSETDHKYYPAAYSEVFSVGSADISGEKRSRSNYGDWVDAFFPGDFLSTIPKNQYGGASGTSQSAAFAALLAAKLLADDSNITSEEISDTLIFYAQRYSERFKTYFRLSDSSQRFLTYSQMGALIQGFFGARPEVVSFLREKYKEIFPLRLTSSQTAEILFKNPDRRFVRKNQAEKIVQDLSLRLGLSNGFHSAPTESNNGLITKDEFLLMLKNN